jgi:plastocyanin
MTPAARGKLLVIYSLCYACVHAHVEGMTNITTLDVSGGVEPYSLTVNVGDTVTWINTQPTWAGSNFIQSYDGEWKSPKLGPGDSYSFTFTNAGFFAYRTGTLAPPFDGSVRVQAWAVAPPAVTINFPEDGSWRSGFPEPAIASATNQASLAQMDFYANGQLIGAATNSPFSIVWQDMPLGYYTLVAKATDRDGAVTSSAPIHVTVTVEFNVWGGHFLPTGEFLLHYVSRPSGVFYSLAGSSELPFTNYTILTDLRRSGIYVDERARGGAVSNQFYTIVTR